MRVLSLSLVLLSLIYFSTPIVAQGNKKGKKSKDVLSEDYYTQLGSNLERLHKLRIGTFVQKHKDQETGAMTPWYVNGEEDSIIVFSCAVGDPRKEGYWIYHHQFMSNMPDMPLYTALEHITAIDRDSFVGKFYKCPIEVSLEDAMKRPKVFNEVKFDKLELTDEIVYYHRVNYTEFHGYSQPYFQRPSDQEEGIYNVDYYQITKEYIQLRGVRHKSKPSLSFIREKAPTQFRTHLVRYYPEDVALFAEFIDKKRRKR